MVKATGDITLTVKLERLAHTDFNKRNDRDGAVMTFDVFVPRNKVSAVKRFFRASKGGAELFAVHSVKER